MSARQTSQLPCMSDRKREEAGKKKKKESPINQWTKRQRERERERESDKFKKIPDMQNILKKLKKFPKIF